MCTWRAVLLRNKHACLIEWLEQAENKFPALYTSVIFGFIPVHFSADASSVIDGKGKDCSYTNHFSSVKNWFNDNIQWPQSMEQRKRYIMKKGRRIMEDHRAISITLTSILEYSSFSNRTNQFLNSSYFLCEVSNHWPTPFPQPSRLISRMIACSTR